MARAYGSIEPEMSHSTTSRRGRSRRLRRTSRSGSPPLRCARRSDRAQVDPSVPAARARVRRDGRIGVASRRSRHRGPRAARARPASVRRSRGGAAVRRRCRRSAIVDLLIIVAGRSIGTAVVGARLGAGRRRSRPSALRYRGGHRVDAGAGAVGGGAFGSPRLSAGSMKPAKTASKTRSHERRCAMVGARAWPARSAAQLGDRVRGGPP